MAGQYLFQMASSQIMPVGPAGCLRRLCVDKCNFQGLRALRKDAFHQRLFFCSRICIHQQPHLRLLGIEYKIAPDLRNLLQDLIVALLFLILITAYIQIDQKGVAGRQRQLAASLFLKGLCETDIG